jgi:hypothetical protein
MDDELLRVLYHQLFHSSNNLRPKGCRYSDAVVLFIYFLSVLRDRSVWAVYPKSNWPLWGRRLTPPSYSQTMRRLRTTSIQSRIEELNRHHREQLPHSLEKFCDGKPLTVGHHAKDPDATIGKLSEWQWGRGYKIHAVVDACGAVDAWEVTGLHAGEGRTAQRLLEPMNLQGCLVRGDANYDSNAIYAVVAERGGRFVAPRRKPGRGLGHHPQHPHRLQAIEQLEGNPESRRFHNRHRARIEQTFAHLTNLPFGLSPLPNAVRRISRVRRYVEVKILLYHVHLARRCQALRATG